MYGPTRAYAMPMLYLWRHSQNMHHYLHSRCVHIHLLVCEQFNLCSVFRFVSFSHNV